MKSILKYPKVSSANKTTSILKYPRRHAQFYQRTTKSILKYPKVSSSDGILCSQDFLRSSCLLELPFPGFLRLGPQPALPIVSSVLAHSAGLPAARLGPQRGFARCEASPAAMLAYFNARLNVLKIKRQHGAPPEVLQRYAEEPYPSYILCFSLSLARSSLSFFSFSLFSLFSLLKRLPSLLSLLSPLFPPLIELTDLTCLGSSLLRVPTPMLLVYSAKPVIAFGGCMPEKTWRSLGNV